jgi:hypothetical protein
MKKQKGEMQFREVGQEGLFAKVCGDTRRPRLPLEVDQRIQIAEYTRVCRPCVRSDLMKRICPHCPT